MLSSPAVGLRSCTVSFVGPTGIRHSVDVTAESLYEAAVLGLNVLRQEEWVDKIAPGVQLEVQVRAPETFHCVTVAQLKRWCEGIAVSPDETLKKWKLLAMMNG